MEFFEKLQELGRNISEQKDIIETEEATKQAFVMPFLSSLGYNVFDPQEVVPEYTADVGTKKGEKVDYLLRSNGNPVMLVECKKIGSELDINHASQLYRYFSVSNAKFAALTDGQRYRFYSDLDSPNQMDPSPFFEVDLLTIREPDEAAVRQLKQFGKSEFDVDLARDIAEDLKYTYGIKALLAKELENPSDEFVKLLASQVYSGRMVHNALEKFREITKRAMHQFLNERIKERLRPTWDEVNTSQEYDESEKSDESEESTEGIVTTPEEIEGYHIVKAIVAQVANPNRVVMRDVRSYCGVLLDDNNRKPICRLNFNHKTQWYLGTFDGNKHEERHPIDSLSDIYKFSEQLRSTVLAYDA